MNNGWIKLYRSTLNNDIVTKNLLHFALWHYILLSVAYDHSRTVKFRGRIITLCPGQMVYGRKQLAQLFNVTEMNIYRTMKDYANEHMIVQQSDNRCTLLSVCNWQCYQEDEQPNEQQTNNGCNDFCCSMNTYTRNKEYISSSSSSPAHTRTHEEAEFGTMLDEIPIDEIGQALLSDQAWVEMSCMTLEATPQQLADMMPIYIAECKSNGIEVKSKSDAKRHFKNYYRIVIKKQYPHGNTTAGNSRNGSADATPRFSSRAERIDSSREKFLQQLAAELAQNGRDDDSFSHLYCPRQEATPSPESRLLLGESDES
ncbi:MAG: hypothetical protein HUJ96_04590 [Marinilabiliaceae bacterium]|mgnify:CR=1 FL=1|nr:hypothetical protein [Marinilabiliaceae bacterium]